MLGVQDLVLSKKHNCSSLLSHLCSPSLLNPLFTSHRNCFRQGALPLLLYFIASWLFRLKSSIKLSVNLVPSEFSLLDLSTIAFLLCPNAASVFSEACCVFSSYKDTWFRAQTYNTF